MLRLVPDKQFKPGDLVSVKNIRNEEPFCIIGFKTNDHNQEVAILKALFNETFIIEKPLGDLKSFLIKGKL